MTKAALLQLTSTDDPDRNLTTIRSMIAEAAENGARFILTPEATNCISLSRQHQMEVLEHEASDLTLSTLRKDAAKLGVWLSIGSLAVKTSDSDGRLANRSFMIAPSGDIAARYDKAHMFDVQLSDTESYRESSGYRPGTKAVVCDTDFGRVGLSICYDLRFPYLYRMLAKAGAAVLLVPSAFAVPTGRAHWETLLRARAIETGCYVLAAAQTGDHGGRHTWGHSIAVSPWGEVLADAGQAPGIVYVTLDLAKVTEARQKVPSLTHDCELSPPE